MTASLEQFQKRYGELVARALTDPAFRAELEANPAGTLVAHGIAVPDGARVEIVDALPAGAGSGNREVIYVLLAADTDELSADDLGAVAGGAQLSTTSTLPSCLSTLIPD